MAVTKKKINTALVAVEAGFNSRFNQSEEFIKYTRGKEVHDALSMASEYLKQDKSITESVRLTAISGLNALLCMDRGAYQTMRVREVLQSVFDIINGVYNQEDVNRLKKLKKDYNALASQTISQNGSSTLGNPGVLKLKDDLKYHYSTYSGADMVCSFDIPGERPIILGELSELSYSVFRAKTPVRTLGRIRTKGFTRGMRVVSGILTFSVFNESAPRIIMEKINQAGYDILMDELPLYNITVSMANEYGSRSTFAIYGVTTTTEGMVAGIDDLQIKNAYQFYALDVSDMKVVK